MALTLALCAALGPIHAAAAPATQADPALTALLKQQTQMLLDDYAHKNVASIVSMLDDGGVLMMGNDIAEVAPSRAQVAQLLENDFALWKSSEFGEPRSFFVQTGGDMATATLDVPWTAQTAAGSRTFVIRLVTVWHHSGGGWKLTEIVNYVPTVGQSAAEILRGSVSPASPR